MYLDTTNFTQFTLSVIIFSSITIQRETLEEEKFGESSKISLVAK